MNRNLAAADNQAGLEAFAQGNLEHSAHLLGRAYRNCADEVGILVNLGLTFMQQGLPEQAERCYRLAMLSPDLRTRRAANKNLGFLHLWRGEWQQGWELHRKRFENEGFLGNQWNGEPLNGQPLIVWNDVGMGDAFQFVRYTLPLVERGEQVILAVHASQIDLFRQHLAWPLHAVVNRDQINLEATPHIPLMTLVGLLDPTTHWGRNWLGPTWDPKRTKTESQEAIGLCWASNPKDRSLHHYKSLAVEDLCQRLGPGETKREWISLQTDETEAHKSIGLEPPQRCWISTLKLASACQRIHSVDTAVAHLGAGAGIAVRLHLGPVFDWRWRGEAPYWYPNLTLQTGQTTS